MYIYKNTYITNNISCYITEWFSGITTLLPLSFGKWELRVFVEFMNDALGFCPKLSRESNLSKSSLRILRMGTVPFGQLPLFCHVWKTFVSAWNVSLVLEFWDSSRKLGILCEIHKFKMNKSLDLRSISWEDIKS